MEKVLKSAAANATRLGNISSEELVISKILADEGPGARRFRAVPMGRAMMYRKKMCHLTIELDVRKNGA
jgi:large subunit ribosomal protein L22